MHWTLLRLSFWMFFLLPVCRLTSAGQVAPLNVLFIAADDLRNDLGCYGHPLAKTPHLDRLAARGLLFNRAYCQQALCNPSRASLMTGLRPDTLRIWDLPTHFRDVRPNVVTLPQAFRRQGYFAQNIGKIFHNWRQDIHGDPDSWDVPAVMHFANHGDDKPQIEGPLPENLARAPRTECCDVPDEAYYDGRVAALSIEALRGLATRKQPFFLAVGFWKPHLPFNAPKRYWDLYDRAKVTLPANPQPPEGVPAVALHNGRELLGDRGRDLSPEDVRELRHGYLACVSYLDAQVGKLLGELERLGLADRTLVVFWSDHGFHLGEHGLWGKTSNFELDARVPLILAPPGYRNGGVKTEALAELLDLYPTLLDLCGLPPARDVDGVSLRPVLDDPQASVRPAAYTQHPRPAYYKAVPDAMGVSVRTDRYRYTQWRDFGGGQIVASELYDHQRDPQETRNLAPAPPDPSAMQAARRLLEKVFPADRRYPRPGDSSGGE